MRDTIIELVSGVSRTPSRQGKSILLAHTPCKQMFGGGKIHLLGIWELLRSPRPRKEGGSRPGRDNWDHTHRGPQLSGKGLDFTPNTAGKEWRVLRGEGPQLDQWTKNSLKFQYDNGSLESDYFERLGHYPRKPRSVSSMLPLQCCSCQTSPELAPNGLRWVSDLHLHRVHLERCEIHLLLKRNQKSKPIHFKKSAFFLKQISKNQILTFK